jgi:hypothetical protein
MAITIELPVTVEQKLRADLGDLAVVGKEAMLVELYRQGKISHGAFAEGLSLSRYEADDVLRRHRVTEDLPSSQELAAQTAGLRNLLNKK